MSKRTFELQAFLSWLIKLGLASEGLCVNDVVELYEGKDE